MRKGFSDRDARQHRFPPEIDNIQDLLTMQPLRYHACAGSRVPKSAESFIARALEFPSERWSVSAAHKRRRYAQTLLRAELREAFRKYEAVVLPARIFHEAQCRESRG